MKAVWGCGFARHPAKKRPIRPLRVGCWFARESGGPDEKSEFRIRPDGFLGNEDGIMAVVFAMMLPVFLVIGALAIDMGYAYQKRNMVQVDASASALAGAGIAMDDATMDGEGNITFAAIDPDGLGFPTNDDLTGPDGIPDGVKDGAVILREALAYAELNIAGEDILDTVDVLPGNWDPATRIFTRAGTWAEGTEIFTADPAEYDSATGNWTDVADPVVPLNAVMTTTRRADDGPNDNPLPLFLAGAVGMPETNINASAIATLSGGIPPPRSLHDRAGPDAASCISCQGRYPNHLRGLRHLREFGRDYSA